MAVDVGQLAPPADVGCLVEDADHGRLEAPAAGVDGKFLGRFNGRHGQGGHQRTGGSLAFLREAVQRPLGSDESSRVELRPVICRALRGDPAGDLAVGEAGEAICRAVP